jgi:hypothetical protein
MGVKCAEQYPDESRFSWLGWVYPCLAALSIVAVIIFAHTEAYPKYTYSSDVVSSLSSNSKHNYDLSNPGT